MIVVSANEIKQNFGKILQDSQRQPVVIRRYGRDTAVLISMEEYRKITEAHVASFERLCERIGADAAAKGLTEDDLADILDRSR